MVVLSWRFGQDVGVWHAGAGQEDSQEMLRCPLQTAGGGRGAHSGTTGRQHPDGGHGGDNHGV